MNFSDCQTMTEDEVVKLCKQPESSISLRKEGLEVTTSRGSGIGARV